MRNLSKTMCCKFWIVSLSLLFNVGCQHNALEVDLRTGVQHTYIAVESENLPLGLFELLRGFEARHEGRMPRGLEKSSNSTHVTQRDQFVEKLDQLATSSKKTFVFVEFFSGGGPNANLTAVYEGILLGQPDKQGIFVNLELSPDIKLKPLESEALELVREISASIVRDSKAVRQQHGEKFSYLIVTYWVDGQRYSGAVSAFGTHIRGFDSLNDSSVATSYALTTLINIGMKKDEMFLGEWWDGMMASIWGIDVPSKKSEDEE